MNQEEIKKILPHRDNMLLVQEAEVVDGVAHGKYKVSGEEFFLKGHFPDHPVVPGPPLPCITILNQSYTNRIFCTVNLIFAKGLCNLNRIVPVIHNEKFAIGFRQPAMDTD